MQQIHNINLQQLIDLIKCNKVLCFGAGIQGQRIAAFFENWGVEKSLLGYIDNNPKRVGTKVYNKNKEYPIYSLETVKKWNKDVLILVTCIDYGIVYNQLKNTHEKNWKYIAIDEVAQAQLEISDYAHVVKESDTQLIPKKIHYAWFGKNMPEELRNNIDHWKELCPDYEFYEWNDKNYDVTCNKYMRQAYEKKIWGFVPDYMRLDIIYQYGGIYLDTDIEMIKKPDELLFQNCFGCIDASLTMNLGSGFGAVQQNNIIRELRDYYDKVDFIRNDGTIDKTSCNTHSFCVLDKYGIKINDKLQNVKGMNIYPMILQGACQHTKTRKVTEKTFWVHYGNMSWFKQEIK